MKSIKEKDAVILYSVGDTPGIIGKKYTQDGFDDSDVMKPNVFYAYDMYTAIERYIHAIAYDAPVRHISKYRCWGRVMHQYYEHYECISVLTRDEIEALIKEVDGITQISIWDALHATHPLTGDANDNVTYDDRLNFMRWIDLHDHPQSSIMDTVADTEMALLYDSEVGHWQTASATNQLYKMPTMRNRAYNSMDKQEKLSVKRFLVAVYGSSLRHKGIPWKYIKHIGEGYPFQCAVDLWNKKLLPVRRADRWELISGEDAKVVYSHPIG